MSDQLDVAYWREQVAKEPSIIGAGLVASLDEILRLRADYWREREANSRLTAERDALLPVVEAARALCAKAKPGRELHIDGPTIRTEFRALHASVAALDQTAPGPAHGATQSAEDGAHVYLSTACHHGEHGYCRCDEGRYGPKVPGTCKFCAAPCRCMCHTEVTPDA